ncbi:DUF2793 domain-containing protein [Isoalcanivorax beigongshangi]|uniref:DUF2793 domain-containing protein n=1 Tax=Isoalcanivorax beigongshangi TaxID=3238810 RepID=A0ABV4AFF6_9GAMM
MSTVNNGIPFVPENTVDPAAGLNQALNVVDALLQVQVQSVGENSPPSSLADGDRFVVGTAPTGAWAGRSGKLARWLNEGWDFYDAVIVVSKADDRLYIRAGSGWMPVG